MKCTECQHAVAATDRSCPNCGVWLSTTPPICDCTQNNEAIGVCVVCGTPVCATCGHREGVLVFCREVSHRTIHRTHGLIAHADSIFEGDWIRANLLLRGIEAVVFSTREHPGVYGLDIPSDVRILVPKDRAEESTTIVRSFTSAGTTE